jgi:hypothetical protein
MACLPREERRESALAGASQPGPGDNQFGTFRFGRDRTNRVPKLLIRRDLQPCPLPAHSGADLLEHLSLARSKWRC